MPGMNHRGLVSLLAVAACGGASPHEGAGAPATGGRVIVVSIDGMMPDAYLAPDAHGLAIPTLRSLVARGAAGRVHGVMPAATGAPIAALIGAK